MGRHVLEVAGVRDEPPQPVAGREGPLRVRRHLHEMDVHVKQARVRFRAPLVALPHGLLEDLDRLRGVRSFRDRPGREVPERPRGAVHDRLREQGRDVRIVSVLRVDGAHRPRVPVVPRVHVGRGGARRVAVFEGADERPLRRGRGARAFPGPDRRVVGGLERTRRVLLVERLPRLVVVGPGRVGDAPPRHRAPGVRVERTPKARDRLLVVVAVGPGEPPVEPALRHLGAGRHRPVVRPEIVAVVVGHGSPPLRVPVAPEGAGARAPGPGPGKGGQSEFSRSSTISGRLAPTPIFPGSRKL